MKNKRKLFFKEGVLALLFVFILSSCTSKVYTPEIKTEFETNALCTFGGFKYNCKIVKTADYVSVTPSDTQAAGMEIKCNGKTVSFVKSGMQREFDIKSIDATNPAVILYEVFTSLDTATARITENGVLFSGNTSAGKYNLISAKSGEPKKLSLDSAQVSFDFAQSY